MDKKRLKEKLSKGISTVEDNPELMKELKKTAKKVTGEESSEDSSESATSSSSEEEKDDSDPRCFTCESKIHACDFCSKKDLCELCTPHASCDLCNRRLCTDCIDEKKLITVNECTLPICKHCFKKAKGKYTEKQEKKKKKKKRKKRKRGGEEDRVEKLKTLIAEDAKEDEIEKNLDAIDERIKKKRRHKKKGDDGHGCYVCGVTKAECWRTHPLDGFYKFTTDPDMAPVISARYCNRCASNLGYSGFKRPQFYLAASALQRKFLSKKWTKVAEEATLYAAKICKENEMKFEKAEQKKKSKK
jgi:hypothetical protein